MLGIVNVSASGDNLVVAAVAGKKIRVKGFELVNGVATANNVKFRSGTTDLHAALPLPLLAGGTNGITDDGDGPDDFLVETVAGAALPLPLLAGGTNGITDDGDGPDDFLVETVAGAALNLNLSAATAVSGVVIYTLE